MVSVRFAGTFVTDSGAVDVVVLEVTRILFGLRAKKD